MFQAIPRLRPLVPAALAALLLAACAPPPARAPAPVEPPVPGRPARVEVLWDTYGIPHIYAQDLSAAIFAQGWAQMRAHGDLLLRLIGQARGRAAEYWGESYVDSDTWVRTNGIPARAEEWLGAQYAEEQTVLDAFTAGINAYGQTHADSIDPALRMVLPVQPQDVLAHVQRVLQFTFLVSADDIAAVRRSFEATPGSNAWAIAPKRSASGHALLLANPHLPWGDLYTWFESQLTAPDLDVYGATLVGFPVPAIAFNDSLGWSFTVNTIDAADLYRLELRGDGYVLDSVYRPFETEQQTLKIRGADGRLTERGITIRRSVHGPVVAQTAANALALRVAALDAPHLLGQQLDMARAQNLQQFEAAFGRLQLPLFTVIYADARGHILSLFGGRVPVRHTGDAQFWRGIVPGNTAATLWTRTHEYWQLPRVLDPATGWVQNANDPPWTTTLPMPLRADRYAPNLAPPPFMSFRAQRSARMLSEDARITFEELVAYKHSTRMEMADHILEDVIHAARTSGSASAAAAAEVLENWDRSADATSRGAVLFHTFASMFRRQAAPGGSPYDVRWDERAPLATPDGLANPLAAAGLLERAAELVRTRWGALDVAWGDVYRLQRDGLDLPASGGPGEVGIFRNLGFEPAGETQFRANGGDSYVAAVEFGSPVRAMAVLGYGNWSQPGSPHRTDQLPLVSQQKLRPVWRTRAEVEANFGFREWF